MPLEEKNTRNPAGPYKYYQFSQIVKETNSPLFPNAWPNFDYLNTDLKKKPKRI